MDFNKFEFSTKYGKIIGLQNQNCNCFMGVPFATAGRFEYAVPVESWKETLDATKNGISCTQSQTYESQSNLESNSFFYNEFRKGIDFKYGEDCLNLNIFTPKTPGKYPVIVYLHGGGFNSGANCELPFDGTTFANNGIITIFINYRVGILGYFTHQEIQNKYGRDGNFGLDDQLTAIKWIKNHIAEFYGDPDNITIMGQSAGAISLQYLCCNHDNEGLFKNAILLSGGGKFPEIALPQLPEKRRPYWEKFITFAGFKNFEELKNADSKIMFKKLEEYSKTIATSGLYTMPVLDGFLIKEPVKNSIKNPIKVNYMMGYTNCDIYAPLLASANHKYAEQNNGYIYFFNQDAKGDNHKAFHASDLNFIFNTLSKSWRPYTEEDYKLAGIMQSFISNFVKTADPNSKDLPYWEKGGKRAMQFGPEIKMTKPHYMKLLGNMLTHKELT